jgi:hypothetical protein
MLILRFLFCILYTFAFSHKEFFKPGEHTSVMRAAVDSFNIFDLVLEIWKNVKWLFVSVILRRPYTHTSDDGRFDVWGAVNGKRDVGAYGHNETYPMLDLPAYESALDADAGDMEEQSSHVPKSLQVPRKYKDIDVEAQSEDSEFDSSKPGQSEAIDLKVERAKAEEANVEEVESAGPPPPLYDKTQEYSNTYGGRRD